MLQDTEIDVFKTPNEPKKISLDHLPSVDELPVLPDLRKSMDVDLAVNADGRVYIFYDGRIAEDTEYVLYSIDDATLNLVSHSGRIQDIGMKVHKPMRKYMRKSTDIYIIEMKDKKPGRIVQIPMLVQDIGF